MNTRFSTEAANADVLGDDSGTSEGMSNNVGADGTPRDRSDRKPKEPKAQSGQSPKDEAKPGNDINAPGFIKDKDDSKP